MNKLIEVLFEGTVLVGLVFVLLWLLVVLISFVGGVVDIFVNHSNDQK